MKQTLQLVGPITNIIDKNRSEFARAQAHYENLGYIVINPHDVAEKLAEVNRENNQPEPTEKEIMATCIGLILTSSDKVAVLDGITNSTGAPIELIVCSSYGIEIIEAYTDRQLTFGAAFSLTHHECDEWNQTHFLTNQIFAVDYRKI